MVVFDQRTILFPSMAFDDIGGCDSFETYVLIDSDEPAERLNAFLKICEEACIASQTIANAIPTQVHLVLNGAQQTEA